ncbi:hypothetical protein ACFQDD_08145 [Halorubrum pallidum]|uniref:Right handed beta helix domain-containing protein n=1 Tax=Halorubrum pallidum TaxID=1526114 RepID=A0ABD5T7E1_9EURY
MGSANPIPSGAGEYSSIHSAIAIKQRDDGSYSDTPATLDGVTIDNVTVEDSANGLRFGEPGVDYSGEPDGPTDVTITDSTFENNDRYHIEDLPNSTTLEDVRNQGQNDFDRVVLTDVGIYSSIDAATSTVESNDTIAVESGVYNESVSVDTSNVTIQGAGDGTTINGSVALSASETTLSDVQVNTSIGDVFPNPVDENNAINVGGNNASVEDATVNAQGNADSYLEAVGIEITADDVVVSESNVSVNVMDGSGDGAVGVSIGTASANGSADIIGNNISATSSGYSFATVTRGDGSSASIYLNELKASGEADDLDGVGFGIEDQAAAADQDVKYNNFAKVDTIEHKTDSGALDMRLNRWENIGGVEFIEGNGDIVYDPVLTTSIDNVDPESPSSIREYGSVLELESDGTRALAVGFSAPPDETAAEVFDDLNVTGNAFTYESGTGYQSVDGEFTPTAGEVIVITTDDEGIDEDVVIPVDAVPDDESGVPTEVQVENGWNLVATGAADDPNNIDYALGGTGSISSTQWLQERPDQPGVATESTYGAFDGTWVYVDGSGSISPGYGSGQTPFQYEGEVLYPAGQYPDELADQVDEDE